MSTKVKLHPLTLEIMLLQDEVRKHSHSTLKHLSKSGVFMPVLSGKTMPKEPPVSLMRLVDNINVEAAKITDFEEFALAIESVAKLARLREGRLPATWLHGGNFFINLDKVPELEITPDMITSAVHRWGVRDNKSLLLREVASPIQLENVIDTDMQLDLWVKGHSIHNCYPWVWLVNDNDRVVNVFISEGGECCPDFSCCNGKPGWDMKQRKLFFKADESTRMQMCMMTLQDLAIESGNDIHMAGSTVHTIN